MPEPVGIAVALFFPEHIEQTHHGRALTAVVVQSQQLESAVGEKRAAFEAESEDGGDLS